MRHLIVANQPFDMQLTIDFGDTKFPPGEALLCEVSLFAHQERTGEAPSARITIGRNVETILLQASEPQGTEAVTNTVRTVNVHGMLQEPGEYRIEAVATLWPANQPFSQKNQAAGLLEGILIKAYERS